MDIEKLGYARVKVEKWNSRDGGYSCPSIDYHRIDVNIVILPSLSRLRFILRFDQLEILPQFGRRTFANYLQQQDFPFFSRHSLSLSILLAPRALSLSLSLSLSVSLSVCLFSVRRALSFPFSSLSTLLTTFKVPVPHEKHTRIYLRKVERRRNDSYETPFTTRLPLCLFVTNFIICQFIRYDAFDHEALSILYAEDSFTFHFLISLRSFLKFLYEGTVPFLNTTRSWRDLTVQRPMYGRALRKCREAIVARGYVIVLFFFYPFFLFLKISFI